MNTAISNADARKQCIQACAECARICTETSMHCLAMGGEHSRPDHMKLLFDCVGICHQSVNFMQRDSAFSRDICNLCADICEQCDASCRALGGEQMKQCADTCRTCAKACRSMAAAALTPAAVH